MRTFGNFVIGLLVCVLSWGLFFTGAYSHEGDIQRQCKEKGIAHGWRGDLICEPIDLDMTEEMKKHVQ